MSTVASYAFKVPKRPHRSLSSILSVERAGCQHRQTDGTIPILYQNLTAILNVSKFTTSCLDISPLVSLCDVKFTIRFKINRIVSLSVTSSWPDCGAKWCKRLWPAYAL